MSSKIVSQFGQRRPVEQLAGGDDRAPKRRGQQRKEHAGQHQIARLVRTVMAPKRVPVAAMPTLANSAMTARRAT